LRASRAVLQAIGTALAFTVIGGWRNRSPAATFTDKSTPGAIRGRKA
jgi:hypothetical protein